MPKRELNITLYDFKRFYYPGENLCGDIALTCSGQTNIFSLRVQLYGKGLVRKLGFPSFDRSENYVNDKIVLLRAEDEFHPITIDSGTYRYYFTVTLPVECPPSVQAKYGWIHYWLRARLRMPFMETKERERKVIVMQRSNFSPSRITRIAMEDEENFVYCPFAHGEIGCRLTCEKDHFSIYEAANVNITIWNRSSKNIHSAILSLKQVFVYYDQIAEERCTNINEADQSYYKKEKNNYKLWEQRNLKSHRLLEKVVTLTLPAVTPSNLLHTDIMAVFYKLHLRVEANYISAVAEQPVTIMADPSLQISPECLRPGLLSATEVVHYDVESELVSLIPRETAAANLEPNRACCIMDIPEMQAPATRMLLSLPSEPPPPYTSQPSLFTLVPPTDSNQPPEEEGDQETETGGIEIDQQAQI